MKFDETDNAIAPEDRDQRSRLCGDANPDSFRGRSRLCKGLMIVGIGNTLRRDDGAGVAVVERLRLVLERTSAVLVTTHQLLPELAEEAAPVRDVVFIDARMGISPGRVTVEEVEQDAKPQAAGVGHYVTPAQLLAISRALYGGSADQRAFVIGIGASDMDHGEGLSMVVHHAVSRVTDMLYRAAMDWSCGEPFRITTEPETCDA